MNGKQYWDAAYYSGAFHKGSAGHGLSDPAWTDVNLVSFDASRVSNIYGSSETVTPESLSTKFFIKF